MRGVSTWVVVLFFGCFLGFGCSTPSSVCKEIAVATCARAKECGLAQAQNASACEEQEIHRMDCKIKTEDSLCVPGEVFKAGDMDSCLRDISHLDCEAILANSKDTVLSKAPPSAPVSCNFCMKKGE